MIVRVQPNGQLLCINQTSHALMAEEFTHHWGNRDFRRPLLGAPVLSAIAQHDSGWYEWELAPQLRPDGYPMDFLHGPIAAVKLGLWRRGMQRAAAQHPYAGLLVGQHAALLYMPDLPRLPVGERQATEALLADQADYLAYLQQLFATDPEMSAALEEATVLAHTRLLQFGDSASLQVLMPWANSRTFPHAPVDFRGEYTPVTMQWAGQTIHFAPWPFAVDEFTVTIHGRLLDQRHFESEAAYHAALAVAPLQRLTWRVVRS